MITETSMRAAYIKIKEPRLNAINWKLLLRKYKNGSISIIEESILRLYAEIYGIFLED